MGTLAKKDDIDVYYYYYYIEIGWKFKRLCQSK